MAKPVPCPERETEAMKIDVVFVGPMRRPWPERARTLEVAEGVLLSELLRSWGYSDEESSRLSCAVNGQAVRLQTPLEEGARGDRLHRLGGLHDRHRARQPPGVDPLGAVG
jgi:sulfur carrier protein ThiS